MLVGSVDKIVRMMDISSGMDVVQYSNNGMVVKTHYLSM